VPSVPASSPALFDQDAASASNKFGRVFDTTISYDHGSRRSAGPRRLRSRSARADPAAGSGRARAPSA
jgi:hypothetical protein